MMPPLEFAEWAIAVIHSVLSVGFSDSAKTKRSGMEGCSQIVVRPGGASSGCFQESEKLSLRRSFVAMTTLS
jgi:hypothetical protein